MPKTNSAHMSGGGSAGAGDAAPVKCVQTLCHAVPMCWCEPKDDTVSRLGLGVAFMVKPKTGAAGWP
jgi:hypothetical protein